MSLSVLIVNSDAFLIEFSLWIAVVVIRRVFLVIGGAIRVTIRTCFLGNCSSASMNVIDEVITMGYAKH